MENAKKIRNQSINPEIKPSINKKPDIDYPVFCFKHLQDASFRKCKDGDFMRNFIYRLSKLCQLEWKKISIEKRHGFGTESIPVEQIKVKLPDFVSPDVKHLTVFRANGDNRPFLGIRNGNVFHIIFIETKFGDIYDH